MRFPIWQQKKNKKWKGVLVRQKVSKTLTQKFTETMTANQITEIDKLAYIFWCDPRKATNLQNSVQLEKEPKIRSRATEDPGGHRMSCPRRGGQELECNKPNNNLLVGHEGGIKLSAWI